MDRVVHKIVSSDQDVGDQFGSSVDLWGGVLVVGAVGEDANGPDSGSAYVFDVSDPSNPVEMQKLASSDGGGGDHFGFSVAVHDDGVVVGADDMDEGTTQDVGGVYLYTGALGSMTEERLEVSTPSEDAFLGRSVSISDGVVVAGAPEDNEFASNGGVVFVFENLGGCAPDLNGDGLLNFFDVSLFLSEQTDFNGDGTFNFFDVSGFLAAFAAGCP